MQLVFICNVEGDLVGYYRGKLRKLKLGRETRY